MSNKWNPLLQEIEEQEDNTHRTASIGQQKHELRKEEAKTRHQLARMFIVWYFFLLFLIFVGAPIYNAWIAQQNFDKALFLNIKELLQVYSSVVGPLAGFVIAYYFKNR